MPGNNLVRLLTIGVSLTMLAVAGGRGFRTQDFLEDHYRRYGSGFGRISQTQYLHLAQQLRDARPGKNVLEMHRADGSGSKFDRRHGWFVAYDRDGTLRTFFVPKEGVRYFERQPQNHAPPD
ncbi:MAG: hypothetical protein ABJC09_17235 [Terriglobia bacterium]